MMRVAAIIALAAIGAVGAIVAGRNAWRIIRWQLKWAWRRLWWFYPAPPDQRYHLWPPLTDDEIQTSEQVNNGDQSGLRPVCNERGRAQYNHVSESDGGIELCESPTGV